MVLPGRRAADAYFDIQRVAPAGHRQAGVTLGLSSEGEHEDENRGWASTRGCRPRLRDASRRDRALDSVAKHLPEFSHGSEMTIEQLLTHTAGLADIYSLERFGAGGYAVLAALIERVSGVSPHD